MLGSISTGADKDEENDKIVVVGDDEDEDFCTYLIGGAVTKGWGGQTRVLTPSWQECCGRLDDQV